MKLKNLIEQLQKLSQPEAEVHVREDGDWIPLTWVIFNERGLVVFLQAEDEQDG